MATYFGRIGGKLQSVFIPLMRSLSSVRLAGIESFEEKIGSFASAEVDSNPDSWLNAAFKKIGVNVEDVGGGGGGENEGEGKEGDLKEAKEKDGEDEKGPLDLNGNKIGEGLENPILEDPASE